RARLRAGARTRPPEPQPPRARAAAREGRSHADHARRREARAGALRSLLPRPLSDQKTPGGGPMTETEDDARTAASSGAVSNADGAVVAERRRTRIALVIESHWNALLRDSHYQARCLLELVVPRRDVEILFVARNAPDNRESDGYRFVTFGSSVNRGRRRMLLD